MDIFGGFPVAFSCIPDWVSCLGFPAVLFAAALCAPRFGRKWYVFCGVILGGLGIAFLGGKSASAGCVYGGLFLAYAAALYPLARRRKKPRAVTLEPAALPIRPPKLAADLPEEAATASAEQWGIRLKYADDLLARLSRAPLVASDKLETELLSKRIMALAVKPLTEEEVCRLNDCLSAVLKLTAKYKL